MKPIHKIAGCLLAAVCLAAAPDTYALAAEPERSATETVTIDKRERSNIQSEDALIRSIHEKDRISSTPGSVVISLEGDAKKDKENVLFSVHRIASFKDGKLNMETPFYGYDLEQIQRPEEVGSLTDRLVSQAEGAGESGWIRKTATNKSGQILLDNMSPGVYLIRAVDTAGYGETIKPVLVSVPLWNSTAHSFSYDVNVIPKHSRPEDKKNKNSSRSSKEGSDKKTAPETAAANNAEKYAKISIAFSVATLLLVFISRKRRNRKC